MVAGVPDGRRSPELTSTPRRCSTAGPDGIVHGATIHGAFHFAHCFAPAATSDVSSHPALADAGDDAAATPTKPERNAKEATAGGGSRRSMRGLLQQGHAYQSVRLG